MKFRTCARIVVLTSFFCMIVCGVLLDSSMFAVHQLMIIFWSNLLSQFIIRLCRYISKRSSELPDARSNQAVYIFMDFNYPTRLLIYVWMFITSFLITHFSELSRNDIPSILVVVAMSVLFEVLQVNECDEWRSQTMSQLKSLDYGSGMAHSYLHGYLKIILPSKGDNNPSLKKRIGIFMDHNQITSSCFPVKKLVILVPKSGFCYPTLQDDINLHENREDIEPCERLQDTLRDRAGTCQRVYRGGAYRLRLKPQRIGDELKFLYVVAEGATPMHTFREAYSSNCHDAEYLRRHKDDVVSMFCSTLKNLLNEDPECGNLAEVIHYDDTKTNVYWVLRDYLLKQHVS